MAITNYPTPSHPEQQLNELTIIDTVDLDSIESGLQKISRFQQIVQKTLKRGHDYGVIPGTDKPTLLKPGAEKILMLMGLSSEYHITERIQDYEEGFFAFTVRCELYKNGTKITEGVGHCNTKERKYINQDPYTLANTCLKMAKKRAQIDATLTVASLSEVFTQDVEDMQEFLQQEKLETMTPTDAANTKVTFGKYKGKMLREIYKEDKQYINWLANNAKDPALKQAAQTVLDGLKEHIKQTEKQQKQQEPEQSKQEVQQKQAELSSEMEQEELNLEELDGIEISDEDVPF
jgi:hypothetical protein